MEKHFMIDIETTGVQALSDDLLQVGIVQCVFYDGEWVPEEDFELLVHSDKQPESDFAKQNMAGLYALANQAPMMTSEEIRAKILAFFLSCGMKGAHDTYLMGWNASNFDIPFLVAKGALVPNYYVKGPDGREVMAGDFHYRVYEMNGALCLAENIVGGRIGGRKDVIEAARLRGTKYGDRLGRQCHDALFDCYAQLNLLNGLIALVKGG